MQYRHRSSAGSTVHRPPFLSGLIWRQWHGLIGRQPIVLLHSGLLARYFVWLPHIWPFRTTAESALDDKTFTPTFQGIIHVVIVLQSFFESMDVKRPKQILLHVFLDSRALFYVVFALAAPALASYRASYGKLGIENEDLGVRPLLSRHLYPPPRRERRLVANVRCGRLAAAVPFAAGRLRQRDVRTVDEPSRFAIAQSAHVNICRETSMNGYGHEYWFAAAPKRLARARVDDRR